MRRSLALGSLLVALASAAAPAHAAREIGPIRICDLDGHCDRVCYVGTSGLRCGPG